MRLKDVLEDEVDEKFYLDDDRVSKLTFNFDKVKSDDDLKVVSNTSATNYNKSNVYHEDGISPTIAARDYKGPNQVLEVNRLGGIFDNDSHTEQRLEINKQGTSNAITTVQKDNYVVEVVDGKDAVITKSPADSDGIDFVGYLDGNKRIKNPTEDQLKLSRTHRQPNRIHSDLGIHPSLSASEVSGRYNVATTNKHDISVVYSDLRIRKLTPKECWRLMGCSDEDFRKAEQVNSNSQLYKQAGNAIVVSVLEGIFYNLFKDTEYMNW